MSQRGAIAAGAPQTKRRVTVLGSTGSIGKSTLDVIAGHPDRFSVDTLTAQKNVDMLADQALACAARAAVIGDATLLPRLQQRLKGSGIEAMGGAEAIVQAAKRPVDFVMAAIVGAAGIAPTLAALESAPVVAIANKESVVCAGDVLFNLARRRGTQILPVDSEHNAIFQILDPGQAGQIEKVYLTASGGPFLRLTREELKSVTPDMALRHPTWAMGAKISVDSATMVNKALEIIEASYIFNLKYQKIAAIIHPQSLVHAMVEYADGTILSHMGAPDMRTAIAHTLGWPNRIKTTGKRMNLEDKINLSFEPTDKKRFPALQIAYDCLQAGGAAPAVFSCANEVAVEAFLQGQLRFDLIEAVCQETLAQSQVRSAKTLDDVLGIVDHARALAAKAIKRLN